MADHIRAHGPIQRGIAVPLTLTALQTLVGGFIYFVELRSGDLLVINEASRDQIGLYNESATAFAGGSLIFGDAVLCTPGEIA